MRNKHRLRGSGSRTMVYGTTAVLAVTGLGASTALAGTTRAP
ncbi:hypothetical protein WB401_07125 [Streptomyces brasiliscabiei]|uniref:Uncharacterized protein n=1 Tax=Streptomyces brasiliscabiei TaxID=2736302 RepID=A0ABU8G386_9ACTN